MLAVYTCVLLAGEATYGNLEFVGIPYISLYFLNCLKIKDRIF